MQRKILIIGGIVFIAAIAFAYFLYQYNLPDRYAPADTARITYLINPDGSTEPLGIEKIQYTEIGDTSYLISGIVVEQPGQRDGDTYIKVATRINAEGNLSGIIDLSVGNSKQKIGAYIAPGYELGEERTYSIFLVSQIAQYLKPDSQIIAMVNVAYDPSVLENPECDVVCQQVVSETNRTSADAVAFLEGLSGGAEPNVPQPKIAISMLTLGSESR